MKKGIPWIEIVGIVAVIISLVFVGFELRHNTAAVSSQAMLELNLEANEIYRTIGADGDLATIMSKGLRGLDNLSEAEVLQFKNIWFSYFNTFEAAFLIHQKGIISDADYETWFKSSCGSYHVPSIRALISQNEIQLNTQFKEQLKQCLEQ